MKKYDIFLNGTREYNICLPDRIKEGTIIVQVLHLYDYITALSKFALRMDELHCNLKKFMTVFLRSGISAQNTLAPHIEKKLYVDHRIGIDLDVSGTAISQISAENAVQFNTSSASAGIKRYRMVSEVAEVSTQDVGAMALQDFFFVTIE